MQGERWALRFFEFCPHEVKFLLQHFMEFLVRLDVIAVDVILTRVFVCRFSWRQCGL